MKRQQWMFMAIGALFASLLLTAPGCSEEAGDGSGTKDFDYYIKLGDNVCGHLSGSYEADFVSGIASFVLTEETCLINITAGWEVVGSADPAAVTSTAFPCTVIMGKETASGKVKFTSTTLTEEGTYGKDYDVEGEITLDDGTKGKVKLPLYMEDMQKIENEMEEMEEMD